MVFHLVPVSIEKATGQHIYDNVLPLILIRYCDPDSWDLGITTLTAA
jgi:solute:Na+ symporter, SSS family